MYKYKHSNYIFNYDSEKNVINVHHKNSAMGKIYCGNEGIDEQEFNNRCERFLKMKNVK